MIEVFFIAAFLFTFLLGIIIGFKLLDWLRSRAEEKSRKSIIGNINNQFDEILRAIKIGRSKFKSRVNSTVYIESTLSEHGSVDVVYFIDKSDIAIFKDGRCIYTSHEVEKSKIDNIVKEIIKRYKHEIENIVSILGMVFSKDEFERIFKIKFEDLNISVNETSDIDRILEDNNNRYDIDEILDKISKGGISSLSPDEKKYLEDYSKNG
jgi:hypothetical protein